MSQQNRWFLAYQQTRLEDLQAIQADLKLSGIESPILEERIASTQGLIQGYLDVIIQPVVEAIELEETENKEATGDKTQNIFQRRRL